MFGTEFSLVLVQIGIQAIVEDREGYWLKNLKAAIFEREEIASTFIFTDNTAHRAE